MDLPILRAFENEIEKIAARAGLKRIRELVEAGDFALADRIAKTPGVLKPTSTEKVMERGRLVVKQRENLGHQIKHLGPKKPKAVRRAEKREIKKEMKKWEASGRKGKKPERWSEQQAGREGLSTLVADPTGLHVRKIIHDEAVTTPEMRRRLGDVLNAAGLHAAKRLEDFRHGHSGREIQLNEFIPGLRGAVEGGADIPGSGKAALKALEDAAKATGNVIGDTHGANVITTVGPDGRPITKVIDSIAAGEAQLRRAIAKEPRLQGLGVMGMLRKGTGAVPSNRDILRRTFDPSAARTSRYDQELAAKIRNIQRTRPAPPTDRPPPPF
jgi:hypothetical protein